VEIVFNWIVLGRTANQDERWCDLYKVVLRWAERGEALVSSWPAPTKRRSVVRAKLLILLACFCIVEHSFLSRAALAAEPTGSLVIIGGALRGNNQDVWGEIVKLAQRRVTDGEKPRIAVFPTASNSPQKVGERAAEFLESRGAEPFLVPLTLRDGDRDYREVAFDEELVRQVRHADGVFICGGDQSKIVAALMTEQGERTPMLEAIWRIYEKGGVVAGSSAGAAVMSRVMFRSAPSVLNVLHTGVKQGQQITDGLGFLGERWFVDQHAIIRGRFARSLVVMQQQSLPFGLAVDENTSLVVEGSHTARVVGYKGAILLDLSKATRDDDVSGFNLKNARISFLDHGDQIDMSSAEVHPAGDKSQGYALDGPQTTSSAPPLVFNDILGNTAVVDLMVRMMQTRRAEAIGLAFDGAKLRQESTQGFEFHFTRDENSKAWSSENRGYEAFTILAVRMDVRPVTFTGPLYR
jgi:cyanophycinase